MRRRRHQPARARHRNRRKRPGHHRNYPPVTPAAAGGREAHRGSGGGTPPGAGAAAQTAAEFRPAAFRAGERAAVSRWTTQTERYISPNRGAGYALGIIGGSLMLILLVYSLRKRWTWLKFLGSTPGWFRFHMVLGIAGPVCILYHSNFATGATNSNVALFSMLTVAGSGLIGRYIYARIHHGLYGRKLELGELRAGAEGLRNLSSRISFLPELVTRIDTAEQRLLKAGPHLSFLGFAKPTVVAIAAFRARWELHHYIRHSLHAGSRRSAVGCRGAQAPVVDRPRLRRQEAGRNAAGSQFRGL